MPLDKDHRASSREISSARSRCRRAKRERSGRLVKLVVHPQRVQHPRPRGMARVGPLPQHLKHSAGFPRHPAVPPNRFLHLNPLGLDMKVPALRFSAVGLQADQDPKDQELEPLDLGLNVVVKGARVPRLVDVLEQPVLERQDRAELGVDAHAVDVEGDGVPEGVVDALAVGAGEGADDGVGLVELGAVLLLELVQVLAEVVGRGEDDFVVVGKGVDGGFVGELVGEVVEQADIELEAVQVVGPRGKGGARDGLVGRLPRHLVLECGPGDARFSGGMPGLLWFRGISKDF
ncbi:hypothetical protein QBC39DRAFT_352563 [Podospora conica]|nr:hypothetical protein QBC39DRAFT_352563 [Schizothecium conicum]